MPEHPAAEGSQQRQQRPPEAAAADEADRLPREQEGAAVHAVVEQRLGACPQLGVAAGNVPCGRERETERHLGDGLPEDRADAEHLDPACEAGGVVDVRQEVALDVEHGAQMRSTCEPLGRERGLADDRRQLLQQWIDELVSSGRAVMPCDRRERLEPDARLGREDLLERPRIGIDEEHRREPSAGSNARCARTRVARGRRRR